LFTELHSYHRIWWGSVLFLG